jgi:hypothetical protein
LSADLAPRPRILLDAAGAAALLAILFMIGRSNQYQTFLYYGGLLLFSIISAVLVAVLAHPASRLGRVFSIQPLRWLGVCSYGIYLWHYPVIVLTSPSLNTGGLNIALAVEQTILSIFLAAVSWYFIEDPIRHGKWKNYWKQLSDILRRSPDLSGFQSKAAIKSIILILCVFISVVSGCSMISHAQQQSLSSKAAGKTEQVSQPEPLSKTEQTTKPAGTDMQKYNENGAETPDGTEAENQDKGKNDVFTGKGVTAIGDSVMVEVGPELKKLFPDLRVDGRIGRQMYQAPQIIKSLKDQGMLGNMVIIELGANGAFTKKQFADILELLGSETKIVIINTRVPKPWESMVNQVLSQASSDAPNVKLVDWYSASIGHNEYFYADGVHLKEAGVQAYVSLVADAINP